MVETILTLMFIIFIGFWAKRIFKKEDKDTLSKFVFSFTMPALIFSSLYKNPPEGSFWEIIVGVWIISIIVGTIALIIGKILKLPRTTQASLFLVTTGGNVTFMGYPILEKLYGNSGLTLGIIYDQLGMITFIYIIGFLIIQFLTTEGDFSWKFISKRFISNPPLWGLIAGLLLKPVPFPNFIIESVSLLGRATTPIMMFVLGLSLEKPKESNKIFPIVSGLILKLIALPFFAYLLTFLLSIHGLSAKVFVIQSAMPSMLFSLVLAIQFNLDYVFTSQVIFYSTLLSLITLNLWIEVIK
ncbi:MAG: AEC family transporter [Dictyoglomaceae bacterium]